MTTEALAAFFAALRDDQQLAERLRVVGTADEFDRLAAELGRERGLEFTPAEFRAAIGEALSRQPSELTEQELQGVAGGAIQTGTCTATCVGGGGEAGSFTTGGTTEMAGILRIVPMPATASVVVCRP